MKDELHQDSKISQMQISQCVKQALVIAWRKSVSAYTSTVPAIYLAWIRERAAANTERWKSRGSYRNLFAACGFTYQRTEKVCNHYGVPVIEDAAEAIGTLYHNHHIGTIGKVGAFSFNGNKIITTSGGGMVVSNDKAIIERIRKLSTQAREPVPHYEHVEIGYNYRLSNVLAAIGLGQMGVIEERVRRKREIYEYYSTHLSDVSGLSFVDEMPYGRHTRWLSVMLVNADEFGADREQIRLKLEDHNIETRPLWKPITLHVVIKGVPRSRFQDCDDKFLWGYTAISNQDSWDRGYNGWGSGPGLSNFQVASTGDHHYVGIDSASTVIEMVEAGADMFLNWVYRTTSGGAIQDPNGVGCNDSVTTPEPWNGFSNRNWTMGGGSVGISNADGKPGNQRHTIMNGFICNIMYGAC